MFYFANATELNQCHQTRNAQTQLKMTEASNGKQANTGMHTTIKFHLFFTCGSGKKITVEHNKITFFTLGKNDYNNEKKVHVTDSLYGKKNEKRAFSL